MKKTKQSFLTSLVALLLLFSMFVGTTFAWFTDEVISSGNVITTGNLDAEMYWSNTLLDKDSADWKTAKDTAIFTEDVIWEPGHTQVRYVKVDNAGSLNFKWKLSIAANGAVTDLAKVIDVYYVDSPAAQITSLDGLTSAGKLNTVLDNNTGVSGELIPGESAIYAIAFHMDKLAGNDYQQMSICDGGFSLTLIAAQGTGESDSFGDDYDVDSAWPQLNLPYYSSTKIDEGKIDSTTNSITEAIPLGSTDDIIYATANPGTKLADGADSLTLSVQKVEDSKAIITLEDGESANPLNVHVEGLASDNQTPILVTLEGALRTGLNSTSVTMYHVENGATVPMTPVSNPTNHNEFSYDPATGNVVLALKSFSEIVPVVDNWNKWEGGFTYDWYTESENIEIIDGVTTYTISSPDQLAGFGKIVDGTAEGIEADSFAGKVVRLGTDIDLLGYYKDSNERMSLNPIGCGYVNGTKNSGNAVGRSFEGTFDGQNHTIRNLYQNGWDLGLSYNNLGGGLFASVHNATIQNLTMVNANIVMECVEQGVIAGLAQGNCNFLNINIYGCKVANYQKATGGVVGEVSQGVDENKNVIKSTHKFYNIHIDANTVIGSLWGDFDAPVGGVIGARWDDDKNTYVEMEKVTVDCRLDVYNDVTSSYQWYAYRRAGMLIGNTDLAAKTESGSTVASTMYSDTDDFLTCKNVTVHYGTWTDYHYCEFSEYNPSWPFVRVEAGENCTAFSNPRWGVPELDGVKVTPENHPITEQTTHANGDDCMVTLTFNQLYGGGQGVYGDPDHDGVVVDKNKYQYTISYVNNGKVLYVKYVTAEEAKSAVSTENPTAQDLALESMKALVGRDDLVFDYWMYSGSGKADTIEAGHTGNVTLYPSFENLYTATFVDQSGNVLGWTTFTANQSGYTTVANKAASIAPPSIGEDMKFNGHWEVRYDINNTTTRKALSDFKNTFDGIEVDITLYPIYIYDGDVNLIPVDTNGDGVTNYYQVGGFGSGGEVTLVEIPENVNGVPVTTINANAFSSFDDLHSVRIPSTVTEINSRSFTDNNNGTGRDTVTLYLEYDPEKPNKWKEAFENYASGDRNGILKQDWDYYMGDGSRVFFLDENGKVINDGSVGYWELHKSGVIFPKFTWIYHDHAYSHTSKCTSHKVSGSVTDYTGICTCKVSGCKGNTRPDAGYWTWVVDYNVNYESDETISTAYVTYGNSIKTLPTPATREGYTFDGWYTAATGGTKVDASYIPTSDITLYAHWIEN